jgi:predicted DNA-binding transcriptional regulator YafY
VRTFKCGRIQQCEMLGESFSVPEGFDLERYWHSKMNSFKKQLSPEGREVPLRQDLQEGE